MPWTPPDYSDYATTQVQSMKPKKSVVRRIIEPGIGSPGTTLAALLPALFFIVQDLQQMISKKSAEDLNAADWKDIVLWLTIAVVGWFSRSHNVSSREAGVE